jgi:hypothetical protein
VLDSSTGVLNLGIEKCKGWIIGEYSNEKQYCPLSGEAGKK